jgi:hypothetical protein
MNFLKGPKQFIIPIYQRTYSWSLKECGQLWDDIIKTTGNGKVSGHFVGTVVYCNLADYPLLTDPLLEIFNQFRRRVLNLDSSVTEEILKLYIAYKSSTNFVDIVPRKLA